MDRQTEQAQRTSNGQTPKNKNNDKQQKHVGTGVMGSWATTEGLWCFRALTAKRGSGANRRGKDQRSDRVSRHSNSVQRTLTKVSLQNVCVAEGPVRSCEASVGPVVKVAVRIVGGGVGRGGQRTKGRRRNYKARKGLADGGGRRDPRSAEEPEEESKGQKDVKETTRRGRGWRTLAVVSRRETNGPC